jgi:hypothetical protein
MTELNFRKLALAAVPGPEWLQTWSSKYDGDDDDEYLKLVKLAQSNALTGEGYVRIGKWKDGVKEHQSGRWKTNVASVAYEIWMEISRQMPSYLEGGETDLLNYWSERAYTDSFPSFSRKKRFGLSRATTLLHFVSGGRYPIFDARVREAIVRLGCPRPEESVGYYMQTYAPLFEEIMEVCQTRDVRQLDKALFSYGGSAGYAEA